MKLAKLVESFGKEKINTLTKYPSILTLHKLGKKGLLTDELNYDFSPIEALEGTEKIDGTNVRIVVYGDEVLIGSRKEILYYSGDLYWNESMGVVDSLFHLEEKGEFPMRKLLGRKELTVFYGELYGGKIGAKAKNYGISKVGFRLFDFCTIPDLSILNNFIDDISKWRESYKDGVYSYGQSFGTRDELLSIVEDERFLVPLLFDNAYNPMNMTHASVLDFLKYVLPSTQVALTDKALKVPEGIVIRSKDRTKIAKLRFSDYKKTMKNKK